MGEYDTYTHEPKGMEPHIQLMAIGDIWIGASQEWIEKYKNELPHQIYFKQLFAEARRNFPFTFLSWNARDRHDKSEFHGLTPRIELPGKLSAEEVMAAWNWLYEYTQTFNREHGYWKT